MNRDAAIKQIIQDRKEQCAAVWHGLEFIQPSTVGSRSEEHIQAAISALSVAFDELLQAERLFTWGNTK
jgi:hypothetical protein